MKAKFKTLHFLGYQLTSALYLLTLCVSFVAIGWLLNGYSASEFVWFITIMIICYVIRVGSGAIVLASIWIVGLMSVAAVRQLWFHDIPRPEFKFIPMTLLANWLFTLGTAWFLGNVSDYFRQQSNSKTRVFLVLIGLVAAGLTCGWQLYYQMLPLFFPPS
ncbi:MAG: hypothetical protein ABL933_10505 [Methyloglobulus sp.]|nr:hypothetical protein [Methyloglobulus sp.]